jgi:hypothetical protein
VFRAKYPDKELECMVQMLITILSHPHTRREPADDARLFASALRSLPSTTIIFAMTPVRSRHNQMHYKRMSEEFRHNLKLVAGTSLGDLLFKNLMAYFMGEDGEHPTMAGLTVASNGAQFWLMLMPV